MLQPIINTIIEIVFGSDLASTVLDNPSLFLLVSITACMLVILVISFVFKFLIKLVDR